MQLLVISSKVTANDLDADCQVLCCNAPVVGEEMSINDLFKLATKSLMNGIIPPAAGR